MRFALIVALASLLAVPAIAQETATCPAYEGIVCDGWVTDAAQMLAAEPAVESAAARFVSDHGHEIAIVVVATTGSIDPLRFATELGNTWGVGDPATDDGIVVLVAIAERRTEIVTGPGLALSNLDDIASTANGFFADDDFDGGLIALITRLGIEISGDRSSPSKRPNDDGGGFDLRTILVAGGVVLVGAAMVRNGHSNALAAARARRQRRVDDELERLDTAGSEFPLLDEYAVRPSPALPDTSVAAAATALRAVIDNRDSGDSDALRALWRGAAIAVIDRDQLLADAEVPLELRASQERRMLDDAVQAAAREALEIPEDESERFELALAELNRLVEALRPHRVASARRRAAASLGDSLTKTPVGWLSATDLGRRFLETTPALESGEQLGTALIEIDAAFSAATAKTARLETVYAALPASTVRPAVAAALADLDDDPAAAISAYQRLRTRLLRRDGDIAADGLEASAIAALLLMNKDEENADEFLDTYQQRRHAGMEPAEAV